MADDARAPTSASFDCTDERATERLGASCAHALMRLEGGPVLVTLSGELGAGKTTLVRAILRSLGHAGPVPSPSAGELENLGLRDLLSDRRLILVEWPENAVGGLPVADIALTIAVAGGRRTIELRAGSARGQILLAGIAASAATEG
jgi:tRNA threonylcarbamoyladenosine biosynthesis protein TsaE